MNILTAPIDSITYEGVVEFCKSQIAENVGLDYKQDIENTGLAKTIAAILWCQALTLDIITSLFRPQFGVKIIEEPL